MNNILKIAACAALVMATAECSDEMYTDMISSEPRAMCVWYNSEQTPGDVTINCDAAAQSSIFHVKAANTGWAIANSAEWITLSAISGNANQDISVTIAANPSFVNSRIAVLTLSSQETDYPISRTITVMQAARIPYFNVSETLLAFTASAGTSSVAVETNVDNWTCTTDTPWLTAKREGSNVTITVAENTGELRNDGVVLLQADMDGTVTTLATIKVTQATASVTSVSKTLKFGPDAGSTTISIESDATWGASVKGDIASALTISPMSGKSGKYDIVVDVATNYTDDTRTGAIEISVGEVVKYTLPVEQIAHKIELSTSDIVVDFEGGSKELAITTNCPWKAKSSELWFTPNVESGESGTTNMLVEINKYSGPDQHSGKIDIMTADEEKVLATVNITQTGYNYITVVCNSALSNSREATVSVDIASNTQWTAESQNSDWLEAKPTSGTGDAKIEILVADNPHTAERTGTVKFKAGYDEKTLSFTQPGRYLKLSKSEMTFDNVGGSAQTFTVDTDGKFDVAPSKDWLKATIQNNTVTLTADPNSGVDERSCEVVVSLTDLAQGESLNRSLTIRQEGYVIETSPATLEFTPDADDCELQVVSNVTWKAEPSQDWLTLSQSTGSKGTSTITVKVQAVTSESSRSAIIEFYTQTGDVKLEKAKVTVNQSKPYLTITGNGKLTNSRSTSIDVNVDCNSAWTVSCDSSWPTLTPTQGKGVGTIKLSIPDNPSINERSANLTVKTNSLSRTLEIKQPGRILSVSASSMTFGKQGGTSDPITVNAEGNYSVTSTESWLTISQNGNKFTATAGEYSGATPRTCEIIVALTDLPTGETKQCVISVQQIGKEQNIVIIGFGSDENWNP